MIQKHLTSYYVFFSSGCERLQCACRPGCEGEGGPGGGWLRGGVRER